MSPEGGALYPPPPPGPTDKSRSPRRSISPAGWVEGSGCSSSGTIPTGASSSVYSVVELKVKEGMGRRGWGEWMGRRGGVSGWLHTAVL